MLLSDSSDALFGRFSIAYFDTEGISDETSYDFCGCHDGFGCRYDRDWREQCRGGSVQPQQVLQAGEVPPFASFAKQLLPAGLVLPTRSRLRWLC